MANYYSGQKICNTCGDPKTFDEFYATSTNKDKLMNICKVCFQEKYAPTRETQLIPVIMLNDSDTERNKKLKTMTNEQVMTKIGEALEYERERKKKNYVKPFIQWDVLLKSKLVNPTKF